MKITTYKRNQIHEQLKFLYTTKLYEYNVDIGYQGTIVCYIDLVRPKIDGIISNFINTNLAEMEQLYDDFPRNVVLDVIKLKYRSKIYTLVANLHCYYKNHDSRVERLRTSYRKTRDTRQTIPV